MVDLLYTGNNIFEVGQSKNKCKSLTDYAYFVAEIRKNLESVTLQESVEQAVDTCIEQGVLKEFLLEQKAEVIAMSIYEYNEEYVRKTLFEDGMEVGMEKGMERGICVLIETCREIGLSREETLEKLEQKCNLPKTTAEAYLEKYWR